jgi:hypothetical protein
MTVPLVRGVFLDGDGRGRGGQHLDHGRRAGALCGQPEGSGGSFPWGIVLLLLVVVGAVLAWVRLRRPIRVELSTLTGRRGARKSAWCGRADGRIYLQRRDDDKPYYDVGCRRPTWSGR